MWYILAASIIVSVYLTISIVSTRTNDKVAKIQGKKVTYKKHNFLSTAFGILNPFLKAFFNTENMKYRLIRSGNSFSHLGISEENFFSFEILYGLVITAIMVLTGSSLQDIILYTALAIGLIEYIVYANTRSRKKKILKDFPNLLVATIGYVEQGLDIRDVFSLLPNQLSEGPLKQEMIRIRNRLGMMKLSTNLEVELQELSKRTGLEEMENYVLALLQNEISGRMTEFLKSQYELIIIDKNLRVKRQTLSKERISSISGVLLVIAALMIIIIPMIISIAQNPLFHH